MKRRPFMAGIAVVLATGLGVATGSGLAGKDDGAHHDAPTKGKPITGTEALGEVWQAVKAREGELSNLIKAKELGRVHDVAFAIRDLVAAMPEKSGQLSAEQQMRLKANVKYVATLAERLDAAGDAEDQSATAASLRQLQSVLGAIEGLYPPAALQ